MMGPELLEQHASEFRTSVGACWPGVRAVFRGQDLHRDLAGIGWMDLFTFGILGRRLTAPQLRVLETVWSLTSYPDARLWNNRVGALAASARSDSVLGLAAGIASTEGTVFGGGPCLQSIDFFLRASELYREGLSAEDIVDAELRVGRRILGYGRPFSSIDERLPPLMRLVDQEGLSTGLHYCLAFEVEAALVRRNPMLKMNYASITAALAADMGFTAREFQLYSIMLTTAGIPPCIVEAASEPEGSLMPMACNQVSYEGADERAWTRTRAPR